jgi:hypothetical protein
MVAAVPVTLQDEAKIINDVKNNTGRKKCQAPFCLKHNKKAIITPLQTHSKFQTYHH